MSFRRLFILLTILNVFSLQLFSQNGNTVLFDKGWRFHLGGSLGAESARFNDSGWRTVDLPHDWSIEDLPGTKSPFQPTAISQVGGGFSTGGTGWYRKTFKLPVNEKDKIYILQFDGVYMNADVWVNGLHLGNHPYGYTSFWYDITKQLNGNGSNTIAVEVKNEGQNSRWYSGSGIYRHVWLKTIDPIHIIPWGTCIVTKEVSENSADIHIKTSLRNETREDVSVQVITRILDNTGRESGKMETTLKLKAGEQIEIKENKVINNPQLWSCETPVLYTAVTNIYQFGKTLNSEETGFGIRSISFDVQNGFRLNGKTIKLKGGCFHHDNGPLGSKAYDRAEQRKVELLKASGFNAIRCSHNPPSPAFLDACDRLGMLVIDESFDTWNYGKNPYDYHLYFKDCWKKDIESMILRDRNHPAIILWSIGNEIEESGNAEGVETAGLLKNLIKTLDSTRAVTAAVNGLNPDKDPFFAVLDIGGYNYAADNDHINNTSYESDHKRIPDRIMVGTESYPLEAFGSWMEVNDNPYVIGDFVWTGFDYIGEASIGWLGYYQSASFYPWNLAFCGDMDICGWKRPQSFYRDALWKNNQLSIFVKPPQSSFKENPNIESWSKWNWMDVVPEWNWKGNENKPMEVTVYSSCERVELFLNSKSLGIQPTNRLTQYIARFKVPYEPGELMAIGYNGHEQTPVNKSYLYTAGATAKIQLSADRTQLKSDGQDLSYITVTLTDAKGHINPLATNLLQFEVSGDAKIIGVGNANPISLESSQLPQRKAWKGRSLVIIKVGNQKGSIQVKAKSAGLKEAVVTLIAD
jgi:beta-galactosidase